MIAFDNGLSGLFDIPIVIPEIHGARKSKLVKNKSGVSDRNEMPSAYEAKATRDKNKPPTFLPQNYRCCFRMLGESRTTSH
jgi:hypothetical protein